LPEQLRGRVDHEAGKKVAVAHKVEVESHSRLAEILAPSAGELVFPVNSSHHQAAERIGAGLCLVGRCLEDGIVEALEGTEGDHFVMAVQWHPERSFEEDEPSRAIFRGLIRAAERRRG
jgi:putative glutamine amidotransferase